MSKTCSFDGCGRRIYCKSLCQAHYRQQWAGKPLTQIRPLNRDIYDRDGRRWCADCKSYKDTSFFFKDSRRVDGLSSVCSECRATTSRLSRYKITPERYLYILESQGYACFLCGGVNKNGWDLAVDHDHSCCPGVKSCGKCIRKLLCQKCNRALGMFNDNPELLMAAARYLEEYKNAG